MFTSALDLTGEVSFDILEGQGEFLVRIPIGFDAERDVVFSIFVALSPLAGYADVPGYELVFNIAEARTDESSAVPHWDGLATKAFLTEAPLRAKVRSLIYQAIELAIDRADPRLVSMTTHTAHLPVKALTKFEDICAIFAEKGFMAGKADSWHGRRLWIMERSD